MTRVWQMTRSAPPVMIMGREAGRALALAAAWGRAVIGLAGTGEDWTL
ncbi:MAG: hypothetical protein LBI84_09360 [Propionibacteriaceae bacterium]|nr:hypothetical protein [Propionibacteriaceae bacterium]